jgi:aspartate aminotransferase-like enzyme
MSDGQQLRIPGPTPLPPEVVAALSKPMINHRSQEFRQLLASVSERLQRVIGTANDVIVLTASGTGGLEAAVANTIEPGDAVLSLCSGYFGERFAQIAERFGAKVAYIRSEPGQPIDPAPVAEAAKKQRFTAVLATHSETSTGVLNDLPAISQALHAAPERPLLLVDGVSSLGAAPLGLADEEYDIAITASQKAWMAPPGLAMLAVSERAFKRAEVCRSPRLYFDVVAARKSASRGETPWTPAETLLYGLDAALDLILLEGVADVFARHRRLSARLRQGLRDLGLSVLSAEAWASPTVTAAFLPAGLAYAQFQAHLEAAYGIQLAGGQGALKDKVFRIGHMGYIADEDIEYLLQSIAGTLQHFAISRGGN